MRHDEFTFWRKVHEIHETSVRCLFVCLQRATSISIVFSLLAGLASLPKLAQKRGREWAAGGRKRRKKTAPSQAQAQQSPTQPYSISMDESHPEFSSQTPFTLTPVLPQVSVLLACLADFDIPMPVLCPQPPSFCSHCSEKTWCPPIGLIHRPWPSQELGPAPAREV